MPILENPRHEKFAQELAKGKTADEAYQIAGYKANRGNATTLKQQQSISIRVAELLAEREQIHGQATARAVERTGLTKEWIIEVLRTNIQRGLQAQQMTNDDGEPIGDFKYEGSVVNRAAELLGKELGMFVDRKEVGKPGEFEEMSADELRTSIARDLAAVGREDLAAAFAGRAGSARGKPN